MGEREAVARSLLGHFVHLAGEGTATPLEVNETFWEDLTSGKLLPTNDGRLVSCYAFTSDWEVWEMHPAGDELVCVIEGDLELLLEVPEGIASVRLSRPGDFGIVPRGTWHSARVHAPTTAFFATAGEGTEHRPAGPDGRRAS